MQRRAAQALPRAADWPHRVIVGVQFHRILSIRRPKSAASTWLPREAAACCQLASVARGTQPSVPRRLHNAPHVCRGRPPPRPIGAQLGQWPAADRAILVIGFAPQVVRSRRSLKWLSSLCGLPSSLLTARRQMERPYTIALRRNSFVIARDRSELLSQFFARGSDRTVTAGCRSETSGSGPSVALNVVDRVGPGHDAYARHALLFVSGATGFRLPQKGCRARNADRRRTHRVDL